MPFFTVKRSVLIQSDPPESLLKSYNKAAKNAVSLKKPSNDHHSVKKIL